MDILQPTVPTLAKTAVRPSPAIVLSAVPRCGLTTMRRMVVAVAVVGLFVAGCGDDTQDDDTGIPNPAAVYCEEQGGVTSGPEPMCELPDGTVVDAWDYYRENHPEDTEP